MSSGSILKRVRFQGGGSSDSGSSGNSREWLDADGCFLFGKHGPTAAGLQGESIERVRRDDPGYLRWIVEQVENICEEDRGIIEAALRRRG